ncbi:MAG: alpha/beta hydrolase [Pseudomonadota bacterium]
MKPYEWPVCGRRVLQIANTSLEVEAIGPPPGSATTLILLHEGLGCVEMWRDFPMRLADLTGLGVLAYSRQGYGQSAPCVLPRPLDYMEREAREVLPSVLDAMGIEQAVLIGHSDGASIAALHQREAPDSRIIGLVLMAPHFFVEDLSIESIANARVAWRETDLSKRLGRYHANVENAFQGWNDAWLDPGFRDWDISDSIDHFGVPCLALQGRQDEYGTARQIEIITERSSASVLTELLDECGHAPFKDQPEAVLARIQTFVGSLKANA